MLPEGTHQPSPTLYPGQLSYPAALTGFGCPPHRSGAASSVGKGENTMQQRGEADLGFKSFSSANSPIPCPQALPAPGLCLPVHPQFQQQQFSLSRPGKESPGYSDCAEEPAMPISSTESETGQEAGLSPHAHPQSHNVTLH